MAIDVSHEYSDKQAVAVNDAAFLCCANPDYNTATPKDAFGVSKALEIGGSYFCAMVTTVLAGAAVMNVDLTTKAADASLSSGGTVIASLQFPAAAAAGTVKYVKIGPGMERLAYLGSVYGAVGANITSGNMNCWLGTAPPMTD